MLTAQIREFEKYLRIERNLSEWREDIREEHPETA